MGNRAPRRAAVLLAAAFVLASLFPGLANQAGARGATSAAVLRPVTRFLDPDERATKRFWTKRRMRAAEPLDLVLDPSEGAGTGPAAAGDSGEPVSVMGSAPAVSAASRAPQPTKLLGGRTSEESARSASVPPGDPIPYSSGMITDTSVFPNITHGKLFFSVPEGAAVCSGTVVSSETLDVVWTAGHCVAEGDESGFYTNFLFVPGYKEGVAPEGEWVAEYAVSTSEWMNGGDLRYDVAALTMAPNGSGEEIQEVVGARGIAFNQDVDQTYRSIGHPQAPPFDGQNMFYCDSDFGYLDDNFPSPPEPMAIGCDMTGGSSGGGWIVEDPESGEGLVHSVNSYGYDDPDGQEYVDTMFGPQMGNVAAAVYEAAGGEVDPPPADTTPPRLTRVSDGPDPFTPLGKRKRRTRIKFKLNETAVVLLTIRNKRGRLVHRIPKTKLAPNFYRTTWNGRNFRTNKVVKRGRYTYRIKATDTAGNSASKSGRVRVRR
ncbi:MAG: hypothetical protein ACRDJL_02805 [Actinomycetota bacterium]